MPIKITNNGLASASVNVTAASSSPAFFPLSTAANGDVLIAATHANGTLLNAASPATPGETIVLYGTGFFMPSGPVIAVFPTPLTPTPLFIIDGLVAQVQFAGIVGPGLWQFNVVVPSATQRGQDALVIAFQGDAVTQVNAFIPMAN